MCVELCLILRVCVWDSMNSSQSDSPTFFMGFSILHFEGIRVTKNVDLVASSLHHERGLGSRAD